MEIDNEIITENPLELENNIVYIEGNLIIDTNKLPLIGIQSMCNANESYERYATKIVRKDLYITDDNVNEYSSFTCFIAKGDIISYECSDDDLPYPFGNADIYSERKREFYQLLDSIEENTSQLMLQMLYISVFSRYEYSVIMNVLYTFQYKTKEIDEFFVKRHKNQVRKIKDNTPDRIKEFLYMGYIRSNVYAGNPQFMRELLLAILNVKVEFPESFTEGYEIRNSIVHRAGCDSNGYPICLTKENVISIANIIDRFTDYITNLFHEDEMKRMNSVRAQLGLPLR